VKKLLLFILPFLFFTAKAQTMMSNRDIYNFDIGDEFQTHVINAPPNATRYTIIAKRFSANGDTVFYQRSNNNYYANVDYSSSPPHLVYSTTIGIDSIYYTYLDTLINAPAKNWVVYACDSYKDSLYNSPAFCNDLIYTMWAVKSTNCAIEKIMYNYSYGYGIGQVLYDYTNTGNNYHTRFELFYYKKGNLTCGTADTSSYASINKFELANNYFKIYPNPANTILNVETNATEKQTLQLFDVNGKLILTQTVNNKAIIDVSNVSSGVYNISLFSSTGVANKKLVIVK
jgi:hypothetical protein